MRKFTLLAAFCFLTSLMIAQETNVLRWGLQLGGHGDKSNYIGGDAVANARFNEGGYGSPALNFVARYDFNKHWKVETGFGFNSIGFEHSISEDYSFTKLSKKYTTVKSSTGTFEMPLIASYKFNPNCKNWKWFVSGGVATVFVGGETTSNEVTKGNDGPTNKVYISNTIEPVKGASLHLRFAAGREKIFDSGRIFNWSFIWNAGLSQMATSTVNYTIDNQSYTHTFGTNGNFFGFRLAYFFKPLYTATPKVVK